MGLRMAWTGLRNTAQTCGMQLMNLVPTCPDMSTTSGDYDQVVICIDNIYWTQEVAAAIEWCPWECCEYCDKDS